MTEIRYVRHTFRGFDLQVGITHLSLEGAHPHILKIPDILAQQYSRDEIPCGLNYRAQQIAKDIKSNPNVISDFSARRTYATGRALALSLNQKKQYGIVTEPGVPVDNLVENTEGDLVPPPEQERIEIGNALREKAHKIARKFLDNLGIHAELKKLPNQPANDLMSYYDLPSWLSPLATIVEMMCGFLKSPVYYLKRAGWPTIKNPQKLLQQAIRVTALNLVIKFPFSPRLQPIVKGVAKYLLDGKNSLLISHDEFIATFLRAFGLIDPLEIYPVGPLHQIVFHSHKEAFTVHEITYKSCPNGRMSTQPIIKKLGTLDKSTLLYWAMDAVTLERTPVGLVEECF